MTVMIPVSDEDLADILKQDPRGMIQVFKEMNRMVRDKPKLLEELFDHVESIGEALIVLEFAKAMVKTFDEGWKKRGNTNTQSKPSH